MTYILPHPENAAGWWIARIGSGPVVSLEWSLVGVLSLESDSFTAVQDHSCPLIRQHSFSFRQPHVHPLVLVCLCLELALHNVKRSNLALFCLAVHLDFISLLSHWLCHMAFLSRQLHGSYLYGTFWNPEDE